VVEAKAIMTWPLQAHDSPVGIVMAGGTLGNADVMSKANSPDGALAQRKAKSKDAAKSAMDEVMEEVMEDDPDAATLGKKSSMYKELQAVAAKARKLTVKQLNIGEGGAASASANARAEGQAEAVAVMAASEADVTDSYDMPPPPEAAEDAPFVRRKTSDGGTRALKRALSAPLARHMSLFEEDRDSQTEAEAEEAEGEGDGDAKELDSERGVATLEGGEQLLARLMSLLEADAMADAAGPPAASAESGAQTPRWRDIGGEDNKRWPPFLTVFKNPPAAYAAACAVGAVVGIAACVGAGWHIKRLLSCPHSTRQSLYVRMAALIIVLAATAVAALCFPKVAVFFVAIRSGYVGLSVLWCVELMVEMGGGFSELCYAIAAEDEAAALVQQQQRQTAAGVRAPGPDGFPEYSAIAQGRYSGVSSLSVAISRRKLMAAWYSTQQYVYVSIAAGAACVVLTGLGLYEEGVLPSHPAIVCLLIVVALSGVVAVGTLSMVHALVNQTLLRNKLYSTGKVTLVQGAVIIAALQPTALAVLMADGLLPGTPIFDTPARSTLWNNLLVCFEALLLFVITLRGFPVCARGE
jgi:hypothetical protein